MSEVVRLTLVSHAMTDAMAAGRFPDDEPLNALGRSQVDVATDRLDEALTAPETRARQTAELMGVRAAVDERLADLDAGWWKGLELGGPAPEELAVWVGQPESAPHGGESVSDLIVRVRTWMDDVGRTPRRLVAVTHPAVVRAAVLIALDAPPKSFWRIDVAPASRTTLHFRHRWTLRLGQR